jgi:methylmalonyl-CoA mutase cobalamin-binding domain/chain
MDQPTSIISDYVPPARADTSYRAAGAKPTAQDPLVQKAVGDLDEDAVMRALQDVSGGGSEAREALAACQDGMTVVGERFETGAYFVADLIYAGELLIDAVKILKPHLGGDGDGSVKNGRMILCTVKGDIHDIGKNIVKSMMEGAAFEVLDLGIDVSPDTIVKKAQENDVQIIGLSGVLTLAIDSMKETVDAFKKLGLRDTVKIIIGGAPVSEEVCAYVGADAWARSPNLTVKTCSAWAKGQTTEPS